MATTQKSLRTTEVDHENGQEVTCAVFVLRQYLLPERHRAPCSGSVHQPEPVCPIYFHRETANEKSIRGAGGRLTIDNSHIITHHGR